MINADMETESELVPILLEASQRLRPLIIARFVAILPLV